MGETSKIEWCDHTFNPWIGCTKVSPGCLNCYAAVSTPVRTMGIKWGKGQPRKRTSEGNWKLPLKWNRAASKADYFCRMQGQDRPNRPRVFCASLSDWLDPEVPIEWLADLLDLIRRTPHLDWLLLTKRPELWRERIQAVIDATFPGFDQHTPAAEIEEYKATDEAKTRSWLCYWHHSPHHPTLHSVPHNVWIGTTVEDQQRADERIPALLKIPAKVRFLSCEPLLGPVEFSNVTRRADAVSVLGQSALTGIHWVICGGESGTGARGMDVRWAESIRSQCQAVGVPFFMKQLGAKPYCSPRHEQTTGFELPISDRKGAIMEEWPVSLVTREFPAATENTTA